MLVVPTFTAAVTAAMAAPACVVCGVLGGLAYTWRHREAAVTVDGPGAAPLAGVFEDGRRLSGGLRFAPNAAAQAVQEAGAGAAPGLAAASSSVSEHAPEAAAQAQLAQQAAPWEAHRAALRANLASEAAAREGLEIELLADEGATLARERRAMVSSLLPDMEALGERRGRGAGDGWEIVQWAAEVYVEALREVASSAAPLFAARTAADVMRCAAAAPPRRLRPQLLTPASRPARACILPMCRRIQAPAPCVDPDEEARIVEEQHLPPGAIHARVFGAGALVNFWPPARGSRVEQGVVEAAVPLSSIQGRSDETGLWYKIRLETPPGAAPLADVFDDGRRLRLRFAPNAAAQAVQEAGAEVGTEAGPGLAAASSSYSEHAPEAAPWEAHRAALRASLAADATAREGLEIELLADEGATLARERRAMVSSLLPNMEGWGERCGRGAGDGWAVVQWAAEVYVEALREVASRAAVRAELLHPLEGGGAPRRSE
jgi:hypothetical protein